MKQWFENLARKLQSKMIGRYGTDELSRFLLWTGVALMVISWFIKQDAGRNGIYLIAWILVIVAYFRTFSKNIIKRSRERDIFLRLTAKIRSRFSLYKRMWKDRKTCNYYRCPKCKTMIRVPKGKGKIIITCKVCRNEITRTT